MTRRRFIEDLWFLAGALFIGQLLDINDQAGWFQAAYYLTIALAAFWLAGTQEERGI